MSDLGNKEVFTDNLRRLMEDNEYTRADIAAKLKCPYSTVNDWFNAKTYPRIDMIERLSNIFRVNKSELIEKNQGELTNEKKVLMDRISKADDKKLSKFKRLLELIDEEERDNW